MKSYPSIPSSNGTSFFEFTADVFDKLEGRNIRVEWSRKAGFTKFGSRHRLFDTTDPDFAPVIPLFHATVQEPLFKICKEARLQKAIIFLEWWGPKTLGGIHHPDDQGKMVLSVIDACFDNRGFLSPKDFRKTFTDHVPTPAYLGQVNWTRGFVERVKAGDIEGVTFEGVVGKQKLPGGEVIRSKAKTQRWLDAIRAAFDEKTANDLINS